MRVGWSAEDSRIVASGHIVDAIVTTLHKSLNGTLLSSQSAIVFISPQYQSQRFFVRVLIVYI